MLRELGDAEVHDLRGVVLEDPDVRRLDVAMHDTARVRVLQAAGDLHQVEELLRQAQELAALDLAIEVFAGQVLLDQIGNALLESEVVDRDDVAVVEIAGDLGLAHEALAGLGLLRGAGLDGDVTLDERVVGLVDDSEAANTYLFKDLILVQSLHERAEMLARRMPRQGGTARWVLRNPHSAAIAAVLSAAGSRIVGPEERRARRVRRQAHPRPVSLHHFGRRISEAGEPPAARRLGERRKLVVQSQWIGIAAECGDGNETSGPLDERRRRERPGPGTLAQHRDARRIGAAERELGAGGVEVLESGVDEAPVGGVAKSLSEAQGAAQAEAHDGDTTIGEELQEGMELQPGRRQGVVLEPDQRRRRGTRAAWPPELGGDRRHGRRAGDAQLDRNGVDEIVRRQCRGETESEGPGLGVRGSRRSANSRSRGNRALATS